MVNESKNNSIGVSPENCVSVNKLIGDIAILLAHAINRENDANGIAQGYRAILFCLADSEGITQYEISKRVGIKPPTTSVALSKMEAEGYVTRETSKDDLRKTIVRLTPKGRELADNMLAVFFDFDKVIAGTLTQKELGTLTELLKVVKERIENGKTDDEAK